MDKLEFEDEKGFMLIDDKFITVIYNPKDDEISGKKYPLYADFDSGNFRILYDVLRILNLGGYLLTEKALEIFDQYAEKWKGKDWEENTDDWKKK